MKPNLDEVVKKYGDEIFINELTLTKIGNWPNCDAQRYFSSKKYFLFSFIGQIEVKLHFGKKFKEIPAEDALLDSIVITTAIKL